MDSVLVGIFAGCTERRHKETEGSRSIVRRDGERCQQLETAYIDKRSLFSVRIGQDENEEGTKNSGDGASAVEIKRSLSLERLGS